MTDEPTRSIELAVEVDGTPQEVWEAIATGPGITSWFVPTTVDETVGGVAAMDYGPDVGVEELQVAAWEPPRRVVFTGHGERALAFEFLVEAADGGSCVVRLVNSGFGHGDDWDGQFDAMERGWRIFLENLRIRLGRAVARRAEAAVATVEVPGPGSAAWRTLCVALGMEEDVSVGSSVVGSSAVGSSVVGSSVDVPVIEGTVVSENRAPGAISRHLIITRPSGGTAFFAVEGDAAGNGDDVAVSAYLYLDTDQHLDTDRADTDRAAADEVRATWTRWLRAVFASEGEVTAPA